METLYTDEFISISYDAEKDIIIDVWTENTQKLSNDAFKDLLKTWKSFLQKYNVSNAITDLVNFRLAMTPELQIWTLENITIPLAREHKYSKHAFIMPKEFIANLAIEQFTEETNEVAAQTKYFATMTEARKWLLN